MSQADQARPAVDDSIVRRARFTIRYKRESDARDDYAWRTDPEIARFDGNAPLTDPFEAFFVSFEHQRRYGVVGREAFSVDDAEGRHIGNVMYYNADSVGGEAEFGIGICSPEHQDRGLGTEATVAFLDFLWRERPFHRVVLHTLAWNVRAIACFEHAGFSQVARVLRRGEWFIRMEARREWWLRWQAEGRFEERAPRQE
jgi:RimJ/RimL family protein N-acetyltransferase